MNAETDNSFTAYIGMDWADSKHDVCVQAADSKEREFDCIPHLADDIEQWAVTMYKRFGGPIAITLELSKGPIVYALQKYDFFVIFPIHPSTLAKYRERSAPVVPKMILPMQSTHWICLYIILIVSNRYSHKVWRCEL
jgi:hypothetical protein